VSSRGSTLGRSALAGALAGFALAATPALGADPSWRLEQPAPPPGAPFKVPLGAPGDIDFFAPNRGLLAVEGNATIGRGIYRWDGRDWKPLATVCGGPGDTTRIAFAGPREFWTVSPPSLPRVGSGTALCHFKDGQVVASYSTPEQSPDPFRQMFSAACNGPSDCWFGGVGSQDPLGERIGAFHLHWDGHELTSVYAPQGRGVTDVEAHAGGLYESVLAGARPENRTQIVDLAEPEPTPRLIHRIGADGAFANDPFEVAALPGVPADGNELLGLDSDGAQLWAVGGGAASGPGAPEGGSVPRPPIAARLAGTVLAQVALDGAQFGATERFSDVAALPGGDKALIASVPFADRRSVNAKAKVATVAANGATSTVRLPVSGAGRGSAARIACASATECWLVTYAGWLFHYTDGTALARDTDAAFQSIIDFRPNEAAEQFVPDKPPVDDSQLFAPPPVELNPNAVEGGETRRLPALIRKVRTKLRGLRLTVTFTLTRRARVQLIAKRGSRTVARTKRKVMRPGRRKLVLKLSRKRYPTRLRFDAKEVRR
jgi:hypothetical protein